MRWRNRATPRRSPTTLRPSKLRANSCPEEARGRRLLALLLKLGPALIVAKGYSTDEFAACYREAYALAQTVGDGPEMFKAVWGLWINDVMHQRFEGAGARAEELIALGDRLGDDDLSLEAIHCRWSSALFRGEARLALTLGTEGAAHYIAERHHKLAHEYGGHDPGVCAHSVRAMSFASWACPAECASGRTRHRAWPKGCITPTASPTRFANAITAFTTLDDAAN